MVEQDRDTGKDWELIEIRKDGAQHYQVLPRPMLKDDTIWLTGWNRTFPPPNIGDTGHMVYRVRPNYGLYFFIKD